MKEKKKTAQREREEKSGAQRQILSPPVNGQRRHKAATAARLLQPGDDKEITVTDGKGKEAAQAATNRCAISFFQMILDVEFSIKTSRDGLNPNQPAVMQRSRGSAVLASRPQGPRLCEVMQQEAAPVWARRPYYRVADRCSLCATRVEL